MVTTPNKCWPLLRLRDVVKVTGLPRSSVYAAVAAGEFPRPLKISHRSSAWVESEVSEWIEARVRERDSRGAA